MLDISSKTIDNDEKEHTATKSFQTHLSVKSSHRQCVSANDCQSCSQDKGDNKVTPMATPNNISKINIQRGCTHKQGQGVIQRLINVISSQPNQNSLLDPNQSCCTCVKNTKLPWVQEGWQNSKPKIKSFAQEQYWRTSILSERWRTSRSKFAHKSHASGWKIRGAFEVVPPLYI